MSLRHTGSCLDPQFAAPEQFVNGAARNQYVWDRPDRNDTKAGVSCSEEPGLCAIASPHSGQDATIAQQRSVKGLPGNVNFTGTYAPLRCSAKSPAVLSLVLQQAMAVADLAQRNLLEYEEGCTLRSCAPDDKLGHGRRGAVHGCVDSASAERMVEPFRSHMQSMARGHGDGGSRSHCLEAYAGGNNPIVLSLRNQPVQVPAEALNGLDKVPLEPYACTKDLRYFIITPKSTKAEAAQFVASTADTYRQCSLGKHSPAPGSQLFPDAPILPLPCPAETRSKEQRRARSTPLNSSKSGGPALSMQESLKQSLQRESLQSGRTVPSFVAVVNPHGSSARANDCHGATGASTTVAVPSASALASDSSHPADTELALRVPFQVPTHGDAVACKSPHDDINAASGATDKQVQQQEGPPTALAKSAEDIADQSVPEWFIRGLCRVCYQLQRRLLLDGKKEFPRRSLRSRHAPAVVVYVVVPSDSLSDVAQSLLLCSQALAPCTSLGLEEAQQQCRMSNSEVSVAAEPSPPMSTQGGVQAAGPPGGIPSAYSCTKEYRKVVSGSAHPWPSILQSIEAFPTNVVLQAITPAMLRDATTCSVRSTAFSVYNKVALAEQGPRCMQLPLQTPEQEALGTQRRAATTVGMPGDQHLAKGRMCSSLPFRKRWVGCCAVFPAFKLAQADLGPPIQPPPIEEGQQPQGWLERFRKTQQPCVGVTRPPPGESPTATKGQAPGSLTVLTGKTAGRQVHRAGSFVSQPASPASASPLPFSDSDSSASQSMSGSRSRAGASVTPKNSCKASPVAQSARVRPANPDTAERHEAEARVTESAKAADNRESKWNDLHVLHCTYTVATADHGRPLVTMAWADAHGELLRQVTDEVPSESIGGGSTHQQQDGMMLAWWCAERLIGETFDLMMRPAAVTLEHVCVTLVLAEDCEQWVWMHVPQLLAARLRGCAALARQLKRVTVLNVAIDDPTYTCHPQVYCEGADKAGMHIVYPGLRPMFHEHVESRAMQYARLRRTGLHTGQPKPPQATGACAGTAPVCEVARSARANGSTMAVLSSKAVNNGGAAHSTKAKMNPAAADTGRQHALGVSGGGKPRPVNGTTSAMESPGRHAEPLDTWGGALERGGIDAASATSPQGVPVADMHGSATADDRKGLLKGEPAGDSHLQTGSDGLASRSAVDENGKDLYGGGTKRPVQASPTARVPKRGRDGFTSSGAQDATFAADVDATGTLRGACPATASVLWQPCGGGAGLGGAHGHQSPLRAMHVAMLCQWQISRAADDGQVDVRWVDPCSDSVVAAARALHRLAFVHWCHWGFAVQAHRAYIVGGAGTATSLPRVAHWPIHCALAARACRLAQQVLA